MGSRLHGHEVYVNYAKGFSTLQELSDALMVGEEREIMPDEIIDKPSSTRLMIGVICRVKEKVLFCREDLLSEPIGFIFGREYPDETTEQVRQRVYDLFARRALEILNIHGIIE